MKFKHIYKYFILFLFTFSCKDKIADNSEKANTPSVKQETAAIIWIDSVINLGKMKMGDTIVFRYRFKNAGKVPLLIKKAETSCSCTSVYPFSATILPGAEGEIKAMFDTRKSIIGFVRKSIRITANTLPDKKELLYGGEITGHKTIVAPGK